MTLRILYIGIFLCCGLSLQAQKKNKHQIPEPKSLEDYNFVLGTQAIGGKYKFTNDSYIVEQAKQVRAMNSNILKISMGRNYTKTYPDMVKDKNIKSTLDLIKTKKDYKKVMDMDFKYIMAWVHTQKYIKFNHSLNEKQKKVLYQEMYELVEYLLTTYSGSGKTFLIGNWEGDWLLHGEGKGKTTPSEERIKAMTDWFNLRQRAIDDAKKNVKHKDVELYHYAEVNLVEKGMRGEKCITESILANTNVDLVSYSSYEAIKRFKTYKELKNHLEKVMDYIEGKLKPKKKLPFSRRVFIGEYGYTTWKGLDNQCEKSRQVMLASLELNLPFALHWEMYNNEFLKNGKSKGMSLISQEGKRKPVYYLHKNYYQAMNAFLKNYKDKHGKYPKPSVFNKKAIEVLKVTEKVELSK